MRITNNLTGATTYDNIKVESSIAKLGIDFSSFAFADSPDLMISADIVSKKGGTKVLLYPQSLKKMLEISSRYEGAYWYDEIGDVLRGTIDIGVGGAYTLEDGEYIKFKITGAHAVQVLNFDVIDHPLDTDLCFSYEPKSVTTKNPTRFSLIGVKAIYFPVANVDNITIDFNPRDKAIKPKSLRYSAKELQAINRDMNDIVRAGKNADGTPLVLYGFEDLYCLDVNEAESLVYEANSNTDHELIIVREIDPTKVNS